MDRRDNHRPGQISLKDLIDVKEWQRIQDNFSAITGVALRTVDSKGRQFSSPSKEPRLCSELLKKSPLKGNICGPCLPTFLGGKAVLDKNLSFNCEAGLCTFIAPLRLDNNVYGYILVGPAILVMRKSKEEYRQFAEEFNLDLEGLWSALLEIKVLSFQGMQSLVELIRDIGEYTLKLVYHNLMKAREATMLMDSPKLSRLLNALLDVAFQITGADVGSIMFFDTNKGELTIRASKGIPDDIVNTARVRLGDSISGIAVQERKSFLIDDSLEDNRIRPYLKRPQISSSMVLPISIEDKVAGVINLGALRTSPVRFNSHNMQLMHKLIDLATVALHE